MKSLLLVLLALLAIKAPPARGADVLEIGPGMEKDLPQGREADGIRGDFVLRNDKIVALISQNAPLRRANMSTFYGAIGVTPGCLYDLTLRKEQNDQITVFCPGEQRGEVSWVRAVPEADPTQAAVETVVTAAKNGGIYKHHEYKVRDGEQGLWITTTVINESKEKARISLKDEWTKFNDQGKLDTIYWADAVNPADKCGYACGSVRRCSDRPAGDGTLALSWNLSPVSRSPGQDFSQWAIHRWKPGAWWRSEQSGSPVGPCKSTLRMRRANLSPPLVPSGDAGKTARSWAYPDQSGDISVSLPEGKQPVHL